MTSSQQEGERGDERKKMIEAMTYLDCVLVSIMSLFEFCDWQGDDGMLRNGFISCHYILKTLSCPQCTHSLGDINKSTHTVNFMRTTVLPPSRQTWHDIFERAEKRKIDEECIQCPSPVYLCDQCLDTIHSSFGVKRRKKLRVISVFLWRPSHLLTP